LIVILLPVLALGGFSSLKVLPGVREAGMGNAGVASGFGPQAMVWNPAATAGVLGFAARASYTKWMLDTHQEAVYVVRNLRALNVGVGVTGFSAGKFEYRTEVPTEEPLGEFEPGDFHFHLNVARSFGSMVDLGLTGRLYYTKAFEEYALGPGLDVGIRVRPVCGLVLGASVVDFARTMAYQREVFRVPVRARLGAAYDMAASEHISVSVTGEGSYYFYARSFDAQTGLEVGWSDFVFLRVGGEWLGETIRPAAGLGVKAGGIRFDYSFTPLNDNLGQAHRFALALGG
jgi:hypothetical protein